VVASSTTVTGLDRPAPGDRARRLRARLRPWVPLLVLVLLCVVIGLVSPNFLDPQNLVRLLNAAAIPMVLACGMTFVILMGSIDLSVEGAMALAAVALSLGVGNDVTSLSLGLPMVAVAILLGGLAGLVNGSIHVGLRVPSLMASLGVGFAGIGMATLILHGVTVRITDPVVRGMALYRLLGLPTAVWVAAAAVLVALLIQDYTRIGRWTYVLGGGEDVAKLSGVPTGRTRILVFTIAGMFYGLGGALAAAQLGQGQALIGQGRLFTTITAVVVGGTALSGGIGGIQNTVIGVLIVTALANGMVLLGVPPYVQQGVQGLLIIAAVALSLDRSRMRIVK
jgi:ribose transport system permease protein